jgi:hypothetical protein
MNTEHMCGDSSKNKKLLIGGGSPLSKDANFPPHQSHAENQLPLSHKLFWPSPLPKTFPSTLQIHTCDTFHWQKTTSICWNLQMSCIRTNFYSWWDKQLYLYVSQNFIFLSITLNYINHEIYICTATRLLRHRLNTWMSVNCWGPWDPLKTLLPSSPYRKFTNSIDQKKREIFRIKMKTK